MVYLLNYIIIYMPNFVNNLFTYMDKVVLIA